MTSIRISSTQDSTKWKKFTERFASAHHSYCWEWREIIAKSFGHQPYYLIAEDNNDVVGILPLFHVRSQLFGSSLISLPYLNGGGALTLTDDCRNQMITEAIRISQELKVRYLELRHREAVATNLTGRSHKVAMLLKLSSDPEELFNSFSAKLRSQIRRPTKSGVVATVDSLSSSLKDFYAVFSKNMRDLGTPVYPLQLFEKTLESFQDKVKVIVVRHNDRPIASGITVGNGLNIEIPWASSLREYNSLSGNMLLYWAAIKQGCLDGYEVFDFGRSSPDSGTFKFKAQWGAQPLPLHWYYSGAVPDVNPKSAKFELLVSCWQRLPLPLANLFGPFLTRSLP